MADALQNSPSKFPVTWRTRVFQLMILVLAAGLIVRQVVEAKSSSDIVFLTFLLLTMVTSALRLGVPTAAGTMSIGYIFILASMAQLTQGQTLLIGVTGTLLHCLFDQKKIDILSILFQVAVVVLGIEAAHVTFLRMMERVPDLGLAAALPIAGTMLFLVTAFPLAATTALREKTYLRRVWQNRFLWSLPYYLAGAALAGLLTAASRLPWWQTGLMIVPLLFLVYRAYWMQIESIEKQKRAAAELSGLQLGMVEALALTIESKEAGAMDQLRRMAAYANRLGAEIGLTDDQAEALRAAALLHDIGQAAVPDHILLKPGKLTPEEYERLKVHPDIGADILERVRFPYPVAPIVRAHHERWDGSGYPHGLRGEEIPLEARILSVVDTYVALTSDRQYRRAQAPEVALSTMEREAGKSFDPQIVDAFLRRFVDLESRAESESSGILNLRPPIGRGPTQGVEAPEFLQAIAAVRREEQSLLEFTRILGSSLNLQETLSAMARRFRRLIPFDTMVLYLRKGDAIETCFIEGENYGLFNGLSMKLGEGLSGTVAASRRPALNADPAAEPAAARNPERLARLQAALSIPLDGPQDVVGVLTFYHEKREAYRADHLSLLLAIGPKLAVTVENSIRFSEAESQAAFDFLTGLPNAGSLFLHLQTELARAARTESPLAVLVCDLDGFKQVNDTYGHLTGNKLLQAVGAGLREYCREYDFVARMGGDEFVVVLPGATEDAVQTRRRRLCTMVEDAGKEICERKTVTLSSGTAYFPRDGRTAEDLLSRADALMYEQKAMRKSLRQPLEETAYTQPPQ